ncbi:MAG: response regulator [Myxococcaceae bacterium]|nr:response regulator [Myxococcaceae bacterium]
MSEVSCRAFSFFTEAEKRGLVVIDELLQNQRLTRPELEDPTNRVRWDDWAELCDRFAAKLGSDDAVVQSGEFALAEGFLGGLLKVVGLVSDPRQLYELGGRWTGPSLYRSVEFGVEPLAGSRSVLFTARLRPGFRPCRSWFLMVQGALASIPRLLSLPDAVVERLEWTGHGAAFRITPPPSRPVGSFFSRALVALRSPNVIFDELSSQQVQVTAALEDMRRSARAFRNTLDALPYLVAVHDKSPRANLLYANPAFASFFGRSQSSLVGVELPSLFPAEARRLVGVADATPHAVQLELGGERFELEVAGFDSIEFGGQQAAIFHARDLTATRRAERQAERSEQALKSLLDAFPDLVMRFDEHLVLRSVHGGIDVPEARLVSERIGQSHRDVVKLFTWVPGALNEGSAAVLEEVHRSGRAASQSASIPGPDGRQQELLIRVVPLGEGVVLIVHDETERRNVERRLQVAERMASLGTLAAGVAHEINNPLSWVLANVELLLSQLEKGESPHDARELLTEVRDGARRIRDTVSRMKEFSRVPPSTRARVDLSKAFERAGRMTHHEFKHCARLELDLPPALPEVMGDDTELTQVFVNLLSNAAQAMPPGASPETHGVTVQARHVEQSVVVTVTDTGVGIPPEVRDRVFDPFVTTKHTSKGTGLGLAISMRTVESVGGTITVESEPGHTVFTVTLPVARLETPVPARSRNTPAPRPSRVLIVDDEPLVGASLVRLLEGHEVEVVTTADAALSRLEAAASPPDLVLCDLMMPGRSGIDVYEQLAASRPELLDRVVMMTGGTFTARAESFLASTPCRVLQKPFGADELRRLLAERSP